MECAVSPGWRRRPPMGLVAEGSPELMPGDRPQERLQDPDESMITLKNEERVFTPISNYDSSGANGFITRNRLSGQHPADSKSASLHNRLDVSGGCCFTLVGMASPEPCTPGFWRRQHRRTRVGWGCALGISHHCRTRICRETSGANHRFFTVCAGCLCDGRFSLEFAGLQRTRTNRHGGRHPVVGCHCYAVACEGETEAINCDRRHRTESGRRRIRNVCLPCGDCFGRSGD